MMVGIGAGGAVDIGCEPSRLRRKVTKALIKSIELLYNSCQENEQTGCGINPSVGFGSKIVIYEGISHYLYV